MGQSACTPASTSDPIADRVTVAKDLRLEQPAQAAEEERAAAAQEEEARQEEERRAAEEEARKEAEEARQIAAAAAKAQAEQEAAQKKVDAYLKSKGFKIISMPRKGFCGAPLLPLHLAVEEGDAETVEALLRCGADPDQKSAKKTARDIAERCNKAGSHDAILSAFAGKAAVCGGA